MQSQFNPLLLAVYLMALLSCALTNASAGEVRTFRKELRQVMGSILRYVRSLFSRRKRLKHSSP